MGNQHNGNIEWLSDSSQDLVGYKRPSDGATVYLPKFIVDAINGNSALVNENGAIIPLIPANNDGHSVMTAPIGQQHARSATDAIGTWSQTTNVISVAVTGHGLVVGDKVALAFVAGTGALAIAGSFIVATRPSADAFTVAATNSATGAGTLEGVTEQTLYSLVIPGGTLGPNDSLRVSAQFAMTNGANDKTLKLKFGSATLLTEVYTTSAAANWNKRISNRGNVARQVFALATDGVSATTVIATQDTATDKTLSITGQKETGSELLVLESVLVEIIRSA